MFAVALWWQVAPANGDLSAGWERILIGLCSGLSVALLGVVVTFARDRGMDRALTGVRTALQKSIDDNHTGHDARIRNVEYIVTGVDGRNGMRKDVHETKESVATLMRFVRRIADHSKIDVSDLE